MAIIIMDGAENGGRDFWGSFSGAYGGPSVVTASTYGMTGSYCYDIGHWGDWACKSLPAASEYYIAFLWRQTYLGEPMISFRCGSNYLISIRPNVTTGAIEVRSQGASGTIIATGTFFISTNTTYHFQIRCKIHDSTGVVQVKINDVLDASYTGDTKPGTDTNIDNVIFEGSGGNQMRYIDDIIVNNAAWPGVLKIVGLSPHAAGSTTQWTTSVSTPNWECVNEAPPSDTDYVSTATADQIDTYSVGNLPAGVGAIKAVQVFGRVKKETSGSPSKANMVVRTNSTDYFGNTLTLPTAWIGAVGIWETNPSSTGIAWDVTAVNSLQAGIKSLT
jgi:hypothetical protein